MIPISTMKLLCVTHVPFERPAAIADWARSRNHSVRIVNGYLGEPFPPVGEVDGVAVMGGPMGANDDAVFSWMTGEKRFIGNCLEREIPVLGVCLGAQLLASVMGAEVMKNREPEIGWFPVHRTGEEEAGLSAAVLPEILLPFHWHSDTFALPAGATRLYSSEACENQAFYLERIALGLQFHLDSTRESVAALVENCADEITDRLYIQPAECLVRGDLCDNMHPVLFGLLDHFFSGGK